MGRVGHEHTAEVLDNMVAGLGADPRTPERPSHPSGRWVRCTISLRAEVIEHSDELKYPQELSGEIRFSNLREPMTNDLVGVGPDIRGIGIRVIPGNGLAPFEVTGISQPTFIANTRLGFMTATSVQRLLGPTSEHARVRSVLRATWLVLTGLVRQDISPKAMKVLTNPASTQPLQSTYFGVHTFFFEDRPFRYRIVSTGDNPSTGDTTFTVYADVLNPAWKHLASAMHEPDHTHIERTIEVADITLAGPVHTTAPSGRADSINPMRLPGGISPCDDDEILALRHSVYQDSFLRRTAALADAQTGLPVDGNPTERTQ